MSFSLTNTSMALLELNSRFVAMKRELRTCHIESSKKTHQNDVA